MNKLAIAAALALMIGSTAQAKLIELLPQARSDVSPARVVAPGTAERPRMAPLASISELPEPEVFAMMFVGLILLGYKVHRDSSEKFK